MPSGVAEWLQMAGYAVPVVVGVYGGWRAVRKPVGAFVGGVASIADLGGMREDIRTIRKEVTANGGGSLKDKVVQLQIEGRHREAMLRTHFANANEGQFQTDDDGKLTWANETLQRWTGQAEHTLHGRSWYSIIATEQQEEFRDQVERAITDRREFRGRCLIRSVTPITDSGGGKLVHYLTDWRMVVVRDPTDPKHVIGYSGNVRLRHQTGEQPALNPPSQDAE